VSARAQRRLTAAAGAIAAAGIAIVIATGGGGRVAAPSATGTTVTAPPATNAPAPGQVEFGANVNWLYDDLSYTTTEIDVQLSALHATGATIARSDTLWEASEPVAPSGGVHHYDWAFDDRIAGMLARHGLRWLPIVDYSAPWAESIPGQDKSAPRSATDYAAYAGAVAARYGPDGAFWRSHPSLAPLPVQQYEIWNEPDNPEFWVPQPDPGAYALLYADARAAIIAVDPSARVLVGGLSNPTGFLPAMLAADPSLRTEIDGVAIHPYGSDPAAVVARVASARDTLAALGMANVPLYVTEFGWSTQPAGTPEWAPAQLRPGYIEDTLEALGRSACGIAAVLVYTWTTPDQDPADKEQWYGISPPGAGPSADVRAFAAGIRAARGAGGAGAVACG
jgi:hypothetical protein